jgi:hypothetical protein
VKARELTPARVSRPFFCAICTADIASATPRQAPLGKNSALVNVCDDCFDEPLCEQREYQSRGYESPQSKGVVRQLVRDGMAKAGIPVMSREERQILNVPLYYGVELGFEVCRIRRINELGRPLSQQDAYSIAREKYGTGVKFMAQTTRYFVYQRPTDAASIAREKYGTGVKLAAIADRLGTRRANVRTRP